jgi:hypothetical protein
MSRESFPIQAGHILSSFDFQPFGAVLQPLIHDAVKECGLTGVRKGTKLPPVFVIWIVLMFVIRRDVNGRKVINWMLSGWRWCEGVLPASATLISKGALSHARKRVGVPVFQALLAKLHGPHGTLSPDFHGRISGAFDGSTGTMPDTPSNRHAWGKPGSRGRAAAFPQLRFMSLLILSTRTIWDLACAPYRGKRTGERALMRRILARLGDVVLLVFLDAGLYSFEMVWTLQQHGHDVIVKVPSTVQLSMLQRLPDGSFLTRIQGSLEDLSRPPSPSGRRHWISKVVTVRAMRVRISGYRPWTLVTTMLDAGIPATEIAEHDHRRWHIEIAYDELKTHQCATLRGQSPTTFRSKCGELVEQELYAMVMMYTTIRLMMVQAAQTADVSPGDLSFLDTLHLVLEAAPFMTLHDEARQVIVFEYLLDVLATARIFRSPQKRVAPRVVKVAHARFPRKRETDVVKILERDTALEILEWREKNAS